MKEAEALMEKGQLDRLKNEEGEERVKCHQIEFMMDSKKLEMDNLKKGRKEK